MAADPDLSVTTLTGNPIVEEARRRWNRANEWEAQSRQRFVDDLKFANGDADNGYQWPNAVRTERQNSLRPCLTMNVVRQHNLQIKNQAKLNKNSVKIIGTGNGATAEAAKIFQGIVRHVEYQSNAQAAYSTALGFAVDAGIGYWRVYTDYEAPDSFNQEIFIGRIWDPLSVFLDLDIQQADGSDARWGMIFDFLPKDQFLQMYPGAEGLASQQPLGIGDIGDTVSEEGHIRVCEYFRKVKTRDSLVSFIDPGDGLRKAILASQLPKQIIRELKDDSLAMWRDTEREEVEWHLIAGEETIDKAIWPGKYIPIVRCVGEEVVVEGLLDRKGHTRAMKDAQRMFNFNASGQIEFVALQSKTPWIAPAKAIEEMETYWNTANTANHSVLPWNHIDDDGNPVPPPERQQPPNASPAFEQGMSTAFNQMMMTSGQFQNAMGMVGNERTGKTIQERQAQADTSVLHFEYNFAEALRYTGKQIIDLAPRIYDTRRVLKIMADDGSDLEIEIDPGLRQAYMQQLNHEQKVIRRVFNPSVGKYDVAADVGPSFGSRRQESVEALTLILTQAPALTGIIGDLLLRSMDFEEAQEAAERLRRMIPPQALGQGPTQTEQALQQQVQQLQALLAKTMQRYGKDQLKLVGKDQMRDIDAYKAETDRFKALSDALMLDEGGVRQVVDQLVEDSMNTRLGPIVSANAGGVSEQSGGSGAAPPPEQPPMPGARKAPDGEWYVLDPTRRGKYLRIAPLAQEKSAGNVVANA